jgi:hypothetical protein
VCIYLKPDGASSVLRYVFYRDIQSCGRALVQPEKTTNAR